MDVHSFISSGLIEAYVTGLASPQEMQELETAMAQHPELATAVEACRRDMEQYILLQAAVPPPAIKDQLLRMISDETAARLNGTEKP